MLKCQIRLNSSYNLYKFMLVLNTSCNTRQNSTYTAPVHAIHNTKPLSISERMVGWGGRCGKINVKGKRKQNKTWKNENCTFLMWAYRNYKQIKGYVNTYVHCL